MMRMCRYIKRFCSPGTRRWLHNQRRRWLHRIPVGWVRFGSLRRITPISQVFGFDRGQPIDRYYIECFLQRYARDIQGAVLEIGENTYTCKYGAGRVTRSDVLHATPRNIQATLVADL